MTKVTSYRKKPVANPTVFGWPVTSAWKIEKVVTIDDVEDPNQTERVAVFKDEAAANEALTMVAFQTTTVSD